MSEKEQNGEETKVEETTSTPTRRVSARVAAAKAKEVETKETKKRAAAVEKPKPVKKVRPQYPRVLFTISMMIKGQVRRGRRA